MKKYILSRSGFVLAWALLAPLAAGQDFTGVQAAALDQPRIYMHVARNPTGAPLAAKVGGQSSSAIECFLDTGASSVVLSATTSKGLNVAHELTAENTPVKYEDVGVGGGEAFEVSEPLYVSTAAYSSSLDGQNNADYSAPIGPIRCEIRASESLLDMVTGGLDVAGMPVILNHVMVMDTRPVNTFMDKIKTSLLPPDSRDIPRADEKVALTFVNFSRFTRITPPGAAGATVAANPLIGPDPFNPADQTPSPMVSYNGKSVKLTMLLDTGAVCSMISRDVARQLGVTYSADGSTLLGVPANQQFSLSIGGIGGQKSSRGFFLDVLAIPTDQNKPLRYLKAPVLVSDITVSDAKTHQTFTLGGVFGMNFLVASAAITGGAIPDLGKLVQGPFAFVVIDPVHGTLGLQFMKSGHSNQ